MTAVLTISIDPTFSVGPLEVSWHGLTTALGLLVGAWLAYTYASERGLDPDPLLTLFWIVALGGIVGAKLLFLLQEDASTALQISGWLASGGFSIYGGLVGGGLAAVGWMARSRLSLRYLDAMAAGLPLGLAVGRVGDLINGEHYGPPSDLPWAIVYTHPESPVPSHDVAYHPGGLYEVLLSLLIFAALWPRRERFKAPLTLLFTTIGAYALGRFVMFFWRDDANQAVAGLNSAQLESLILLALSTGGVLAATRKGRTKAADQL